MAFEFRLQQILYLAAISLLEQGVLFLLAQPKSIRSVESAVPFPGQFFPELAAEMLLMQREGNDACRNNEKANDDEYSHWILLCRNR